MATIRQVPVMKRGCGFRMAGAIYLVGDAPAHVCGKLPLKLDRCPTCDHGIKFSRGWTWIDPVELWGERKCRFTDSGGIEDGLCKNRCPFYDVENRIGRKMGLLWIGKASYTVDEFGQEMEDMGFSRKIKTVPRGFEVGKSWVAFAHLEVIREIDKEVEIQKGSMVHVNLPTLTHCDIEVQKVKEDEPCILVHLDEEKVWVRTSEVTYLGTPVKRAAIFSVVRPQRIEYVVKGDETIEELDALEKRGFTLVKDVVVEDLKKAWEDLGRGGAEEGELTEAHTEQ
jgi:hypothetical protein